MSVTFTLGAGAGADEFPLFLNCSFLHQIHICGSWAFLYSNKTNIWIRFIQHKIKVWA